jgi:hypothetical protein
MGFLGIYKAVYDYTPQADSELPITEGDLLYILEKQPDDDWWKAKKRASADEEDKPTGLIPNNYVEEVRALSVILRPFLMLLQQGSTDRSCSSSLRIYATDGRGALFPGRRSLRSL